jgi:hypothetical protein
MMEIAYHHPANPKSQPKSPTTKGTNYHEGIDSQAFPSCDFVAFMVKVFSLTIFIPKRLTQ